MEQKIASQPGRPRCFDRDAALATAMELFWRHGYEGVSIADLTRAMGIAAPSLYAAFGSKAALFREVLELYQRRPGAGVQMAFLEDGPIRERVAASLAVVVRACTEAGYPRGCMITTGLLTCGPDHAELAAALADLRHKRRAQMTDRLQRAIAAGDLPPEADAAALARYLSAVMQGLAIQARDGASAEELAATVDVVLRNWPG
jgi:AcrR family transcriptional regulator